MKTLKKNNPTKGKLITKKSPSGKLKKVKKVKKTTIKNDKPKSNTKNTHQEQLDNLKKIDPEFYEFLKKNDKKLLEFNLYDDDDDDDDSVINSEDENKEKAKTKNIGAVEKTDSDSESFDKDDENENKYHIPKPDLEVPSDESDFEYEDFVSENVESNRPKKITLNLLHQWQLGLESSQVSINIIRKVIRAFNAALTSIVPRMEEENKSANMPVQVVGSAVFNGVIQLCVLYLQPALHRYLGLSKQTVQHRPLHKTKKWDKVRSCLRCYLTDLIRLIEHISGSNILSVLLKHLHQMAAMVVPFSHLGKNILKRLIVLWSSADETIRILSFLCILKITRNQQGTMLNHVLKAMYMSYVRNAKFVSPNTLPAINFMRRSLVEMFTLDLNTSYQHVFLYIRQLAIHLRNAVILKKDSYQAVYNWQYINALRLWSELLSTTYDKPQLQPLMYPYVTITIGVVRLVPTAQYFPLRFHCLQALIALARSTNIFIPVLPLILETLRSNTFQQKHTIVSMKPLQFTCILRLTKHQLAENGFRDEVIEQVCALCLEYLAHESASLAFSDLVVPAVMALKAYLKQCRNANYTRKLKQLVEKILENARFIDAERRKTNFNLKDVMQIQAWETQIYNKGTPLNTYYNNWLKIHETKKRRLAAQSDNINDGYDLPMIKKCQNKLPKEIVRNAKGEVELFPSDAEDDNMNENQSDLRSMEKENTPRKKLKKTEGVNNKSDHLLDVNSVPVEDIDTNDQVDIVKDLDLNDW